MSNMVDSAQLRSYVERIERIEATIRDEQEARKEVYQEAKSTGFDAKVIREIVAMRKQDKAKREEFEEILDLYMAALGDLGDTPLGRSAVEREFGGARG
jgi:uncharacterized protein (UPF0335 family)